MLVKPQIGFTYDCRRCEKTVTGLAELFPLGSRQKVIRCSCGESALVVRLQAGLLTIEYPCGICGKRHRAVIPLSAVWECGIAELCCPLTETPACLAGRPEYLKQGLSGITHASQRSDSEKLSPTPAEVLCTAQQMAAEHRIFCRCGSSRLRASYESGKLDISCAECGARGCFPLPSIQALTALRAMRRIIL